MEFIKMEGLGNDYVYVDCLKDGPPPGDLAALAREISDRHFGVGGDGMILILPSDVADFRMRIFNADGSEAEMCGNGIRCFAKYVYESGYVRREEIAVETGAGIVRPRVLAEGGRVHRVRVDMGEPRLLREEIPMLGPRGQTVVDEILEVGRHEHRVTAVSMGNPHCILFVDDVEGADVARIGPQIEHHRSFPHRTNVHFVQVVSPSEVVMRSWERGSGMTLACGTGACASVVAGVLTGRTGRQVTVHLPGGDLEIEWAGADNRVYMTGPATEVFRGTYRRR